MTELLRGRLDSNTSVTLLLRLRDLDDHDAWEVFVHRYAPQVFSWCRQNGLQESDAADVSQQVLYKLAMAMRGFEYDSTKGGFRAWLKTVTTNAVHDLFRQWKRHARGSGDSQVLCLLAEVPDNRACDQLVDVIRTESDRELLEEAERRVKIRLKPHTWDAYEMTAVQQVSPQDTAKELGIAVSDVYVAKSRVIKMLRAEVLKLEGLRGSE